MNAANKNDVKTVMVESRKIDDGRIVQGMEEEFFQLLDNAMDVGVSILDEDFNYVYINQYAFDTLQLKKGEFKSASLSIKFMI